MKVDFNTYLSEVTNWWTDKNQVDVLKFLGYLNDELYEDILKAVDLVQEIYPDRWDLQLRIKNSTQYRTLKTPFRIEFIIHFPKVTITNSLRQTHDIHDLYVRFLIAEDGVLTYGNLTGFRTTISFAEYRAGFLHSHLGTTNFKKLEYQNFCIGEGVTQQIEMMMITEDRLNVDLFKMYLFEIQQYVGWESVEGGPYAHIGNIKLRGTAGFLNNLEHSTIAYYIRRTKEKLFKMELDSLNLKLDKNNIISVIDDEAFEIFAQTTINFLSNGGYCAKDSDGNYVDYEASEKSEKSINEISKDYIVFKGQKLQYNIDISIIDAEMTKYLHPTLKNILKTIIEYELNKEQIKAIAFK